MSVTLAAAANTVRSMEYTSLSQAASSGRPPLGMPAVVSRDELFFWEQEWQDGERESAEERAAGGLVSFDSPTALMQWLMTED